MSTGSCRAQLVHETGHASQLRASRDSQDLIERIEAFLGADCGEEGSLLACPRLRLKVSLQQSLDRMGRVGAVEDPPARKCGTPRSSRSLQPWPLEEGQDEPQRWLEAEFNSPCTLVSLLL